MSKAAIYARKSKATEKGASVENQINKCKAHLNNLDITDVLIYKDDGLYQVRVGVYNDIREAMDAQKNFQEKGYATLIVRAN